ncbi:MAG TPA: hypothetical protein VFS21_20925 [Roseiflexaceae bacterium]|nr:hypothetical protein [Roseiflexaceae bacterium]
MSESTPNPGQGKDGKETPDFTAELRELGSQFEAVFRAAIESDRAKQLQHDLASGVRELSHQVQESLKNLQDDPRVQRAEERGRDLLNQAQQSKVVQDLQETLVNGIAQLNVQLRKLAERIETNSTAAATPTQNVPVEHDQTTATGPTTRLDDDTPTQS